MTILRELIVGAKADLKRSLNDFTVLSPARDPYRLDTSANHELGQWMRDATHEVHQGGTIHSRGLHYKFVGRVTMPNGQPYINDDETWLWMSNKALKAARFLGYLPWGMFKDARNSAPISFRPEANSFRGWFLSGGSVDLELPADINPEFRLYGDMYRQPYQQLVIAEKSGVEPVVLPLCKQMGATLCLPTGELSDQLMFQLLREAAEDGRPLAIHQLGDFDPAGHQMAVSTARTAQALCSTEFPDLDVVVHTPGLTLEQCREWALPSTPLKETEKRGDAWTRHWEWEQTELDAAVALVPEKLRLAVQKSMAQYYDESLGHRAWELRRELTEAANKQLSEAMADSNLLAMREQLQEKLYELESMRTLPPEISLFSAASPHSY